MDKEKEELGVAEFLSANYHPTLSKWTCNLRRRYEKSYIVRKKRSKIYFKCNWKNRTGKTTKREKKR